MKQMQLLDALRNIKKRFVSFLSVCFIIALAIGGMLITTNVVKSWNFESSKFFKEANFKDFELVSSLGITDQDIEKIEKTPHIQDVEGVFVFDGKVTFKDENIKSQILSLTNKVSVPFLLEGNYPKKTNECAIGYDMADDYGIKIGDKVNLAILGNYQESPLIEKEFIVSGIISHVDYLRYASTRYVVLAKEAFNPKATNNSYTRAFVKMDYQDSPKTYEKEYQDKVDEVSKELTTLTKQMEVDSVNRMKQEAYELIEEEAKPYRIQIEEAKQLLEDGEKQLEEELTAAKEKADEGERELYNAYQKLIDGQNQINNAEIQLADGKAQVQKGDDFLAAIQKEQLTKDLKDFKNDLINYQNAIDLNNEKEIASNKEKVEERLNSNVAQMVFEMANSKAINDAGNEIKDGKNLNNYISMLDTMISFVQSDKYPNEITVDYLIYELNDIDMFLDDIGDSIPNNPEAAKIVINLFLNTLMEDGDNFVDLVDAFIDELYAQGDPKVVLKGKINNAREGLAEYQKGKELIKEGEVKLANAKEELANGWALYYQGVEQLNDGRNLLVEKEKEAREKLQEAKDEFESKKKEFDDKLNEAKSKVDDLRCTWIVEQRSVNEGFLDFSSNRNAISKSGKLFGIFFFVIASLVCFSTIAMNVEEEKKNVGTNKAFGLRNNEIFSKFLIFSICAVIIGAIAGILLSIAISVYVLDLFEKVHIYIFPMGSVKLDYMVALIAPIIMMIICILTTVIACTNLLKTPASILMKGDTLADKKKQQKTMKKETKSSGNLYSHLIWRNMSNEIPRVAITIVIVAISSLVMGMGVTLHDSFKGMLDIQLTDVNTYDVRIDYASTTEEELKQIDEVLNQKNIDYVKATYEAHIFDNRKAISGIYVLSSSDERLGEFVKMRDPKTKEELKMPDDGVMVQLKLKENYNLKNGDTLLIYNNSLKEKEVPVSGVFQNYQGRIVICSKEGYKKLFGEESKDNCYFIKLNGQDYNELTKVLNDISPDMRFERSDNFHNKYAAVLKLYDALVYIMTIIAVLMSFMIITNLANIYFTRKKKELIVMRVNGFSTKQAKKYLYREVILTTTIGLIIAVVGGCLFTSTMAKIVEHPDVQFVRTISIRAWIFAVVLEIIFAAIIHILVFKKVKKLNFREIQ